LLQVQDGKYCCPDLTILIRVCIDRVFFLLQDAYPDSRLREVFGDLFESYVNGLLHEATGSTRKARVFLPSPKFERSNDEAADGILCWVNTAAIMEYKAGLLTTRERYAGVPDVLLRGIECKLSGDKKERGVSQLARNIGRILSGEKVSVDNFTIDLSSCRRLYPILVCFDESLGFHAVAKLLQRRFNEELARYKVPNEVVGPLMLLSVGDVENLATTAHTVSIEQILQRYASHLETQVKDFTASFTSVLEHHFGGQIDWLTSKSFLKHQDLIKELLGRLGPSASLDSDVEETMDDHFTTL
jgi:hypothetical protein